VYGELKTPEERVKMVEDVIIASTRKGTGKEVTRTQNLMDTGVTMSQAVEVIESLRRRFPIKFEVSRPLPSATVSLSCFMR